MINIDALNNSSKLTLNTNIWFALRKKMSLKTVTVRRVLSVIFQSWSFLNLSQLYFTEHTLYAVSVCMRFHVISRIIDDDDCDLNARVCTSVNVAFCHNKGLWYSLPFSTSHYISGLALFPPLMPRGIDSRPLPSSFVLEVNILNQWKTEFDRGVCCHIHQDYTRFFHECLCVIQLECFPISNVLVVNCLYSEPFPHLCL